MDLTKRTTQFMPQENNKGRQAEKNKEKKFVTFKTVNELSLSGGRVVTPGVYYPPNRNFHCTFRHSLHQNFKRLVTKNGKINIEKSLTNKGFKNYFIKMVGTRWRWVILKLFAAYILNWLFFALIYWFIALVHGDFTSNHLPINRNSSHRLPCVTGINGFSSTFLFSVEVLTTIAYGKRFITPECPEAVFVMCLQRIISCVFQVFMVGILFAKLTKHNTTAESILFSTNAVISLKDKKLCLSFRVGDVRKSTMLNIKTSVFITRLETSKSRLHDFEPIELPTILDGCESTFFLWPLSVTHVIDDRSPLYNLSAADFLSGSLEILLVFEGFIQCTGQPVQARTSYIQSEIYWGHRFVPMVEYNATKNIFDVDYLKFSKVQQINTPLCSACEYESFLERK